MHAGWGSLWEPRPVSLALGREGNARGRVTGCHGCPREPRKAPEDQPAGRAALSALGGQMVSWRAASQTRLAWQVLLCLAGAPTATDAARPGATFQ